MPILDLQSRFGINLDRWMLLQSGYQPNKRVTLCHAFEKEWIECAHGIGQTRAKKECQLEYEDFYECLHMGKLNRKVQAVLDQREKMIKEGTYKPPPCHTGAGEESP